MSAASSASASGYAWSLGNIEVSLQPNSLSRPPYLHYWAIDSGKWRLRKISEEKFLKSCCGGNSRPDESACLRYDGIVEHIVIENDTIESICEHYGCSIHSLIQANGGTLLNSSPLPKYLRVPVKIGFPVSKIQCNDRNVVLQRFVLETELSQEEATEILISHDFDYIRAMNQWDQSHTWEQQYLSSIKQTAPIYVTSYSRLHMSDVAENSVGSALPPPPVGYDWKSLPNGEWELAAIPQNNPSETTESEGNISPNTSTYFVHRIKPSDTLEGICLRYHTNQRAVMKMNHLSTNKIQLLKELRIPLRSGQASPAIEEEVVEEGNNERDLIQNFAQETNVSLKEAKYYLQLSHYNYREALQEWKADDEWCQKNELGKDIAKQTTGGAGGADKEKSSSGVEVLEISY